MRNPSALPDPSPEGGSRGNKKKQRKTAARQAAQRTPSDTIRFLLRPALPDAQITQLLNDWPKLTDYVVLSQSEPPLSEPLRDRLAAIFPESQLELLLKPFVFKPKPVLLTVAGAYLTHKLSLLQVVADVWDHWAGWVRMCQLPCCAESDEEVDEALSLKEDDEADLDQCLAVLAGDPDYM